MNSRRMSELEDGAEPTGFEVFTGFLMLLALLSFVGGLIVCFVFRMKGN